jgi:hypothetical protein
VSAEIRPIPTEEEAAAIMAAIQVTMSGGAAAPEVEEPARWRWSGRWWSKPMALRRDRPW